MDVKNLVRNYVLGLTHASTGAVSSHTVNLSKNENGLGSPFHKWYNRYVQSDEALVKSIAEIKNTSSESLLLTNGTSSAVSLILDCFCEPGNDTVIVCEPSYPLYKHQSLLHGANVKTAALAEGFQLDLVHLENMGNAKIFWICSPNNPTGNNLNREDIEAVLNNFEGLVVIDEAYINFSKQKSFIADITDYPNLIVLQNFSIAWGMAGLNVSLIAASNEVIEFLKRIQNKPALAAPVMEIMLEAVKNYGQVNEMIREIADMRNAFADVLKQMKMVKKVYPSDANFLLVEFDDADDVYNYLLQKNILVKQITDDAIKNCLRISIGSDHELTGLVNALADYMEKRNN